METWTDRCLSVAPLSSNIYLQVEGLIIIYFSVYIKKKIIVVISTIIIKYIINISNENYNVFSYVQDTEIYR